ncbi:winged helix-turn-helix domain-containing protein [Micromonospora zhanjiangensis]|uniref:Winged helix-turn-helix domain-containing protein n=1 Tax=Micromonospora zhanjiangensis TaxID=1522057 RepID=A0ABV8KU08_9ACTN
MGVLLARDSRGSAASWCRRHTLGGDGAVAAVRRARQPGERAALRRDQELELVDLLRGRYPEQLGLSDGLWHRQNLTVLIQRRFDLPLDATDVGEYLRAWGLGPREPTDRACGLCVEAVGRWLREDFPAIDRSARDHHAEVHWVGRTRLYGAAPSADVLSATSDRGRTQFLITSPTVDTPPTRDFLLRLSGPDGRAVHVVVDGSWSRTDWPRRLPAHITLYALPSCGRGA